MNFSGVSAAMEGFRLIGRKPGTFLVWCLAYFAVLIAIGVLVFVTAGPALMAAAQNGAQAALSPAQSMQMLGPIMLVVYPTTLLWMSVFYCAIFRAVLRPKDTGFAYLKVSADELRVILLVILMAVIVLAVWFVGALVLTLLIGVVTATLGKAAIFVDILIGVLVFCAYIWICVRLCLLLPFTFAERRIDIPAAWRLTGGHFWSLVGMFLLDMAMVIGIVIACYLVVGMLFAGAFVGTMAGHGHAITPALGAMAVVGGLAMLALYFVMPTLMAVVLVAPFAAAYRDLTGPKEDEAAKAFA